MKPLKALRKILTITAISFVSGAGLYAFIIPAKEDNFEQCFSKNYDFTCTDPDDFLKKMGIDIEKNIIQMSDLHSTDDFKRGHHKGSFFADEEDNEYFVKKCGLFNEFMGSRLMNVILEENSPLIKIVKDRISTTAAEKLPKFVRKRDYIKKKESRRNKHTITDEVRLAIAMDYIGLCDRNDKNMGYRRLKPRTQFSAVRVDYDTSFRFGKNGRWSGIGVNIDYLDLSLLEISIKKFPRDQVIKALAKVVSTPDKEIIMAVVEGWATLRHIGYNLPLDTGFTFAKQMIERKKAFNKILVQMLTNPEKFQQEPAQPSEKNVNPEKAQTVTPKIKMEKKEENKSPQKIKKPQ